MSFEVEPAAAYCLMCEAHREAARDLVDAFKRQQELMFKIAERLLVCSQHLSVVAEKPEKRRER